MNLSKSRYTLGTRCEKLLWLSLYKEEESDDLNNQIRSIVVKNKAKKVKPGYKKKVKEEIEKTKQKQRREMIKQNIKDQIKKRAIEKTKREKYGDEYV